MSLFLYGLLNLARLDASVTSYVTLAERRRLIIVQAEKKPLYNLQSSIECEKLNGRGKDLHLNVKSFGGMQQFATYDIDNETGNIRVT